MDRFAELRPAGLARKTLLIAVAVIVVMLACATVVLSQGRGGYYPFWDYGTDGMPRPDGLLRQQDPGQRPITYDAKPSADGSIVIRRNGVPWITVANGKNQFVLSDPNGTGHPVIKFEQSTSRSTRRMPLRLRVPAR